MVRICANKVVVTVLMIPNKPLIARVAVVFLQYGKCIRVVAVSNPCRTRNPLKLIIHLESNAGGKQKATNVRL